MACLSGTPRSRCHLSMTYLHRYLETGTSLKERGSDKHWWLYAPDLSEPSRRGPTLSLFGVSGLARVPSQTSHPPHLQMRHWLCALLSWLGHRAVEGAQLEVQRQELCTVWRPTKLYTHLVRASSSAPGAIDSTCLPDLIELVYVSRTYTGRVKNQE